MCSFRLLFIHIMFVATSVTHLFLAPSVIHLELIYVNYYGYFHLIHFNIVIDYLLMLTIFMYKMYFSFSIDVYLKVFLKCFPYVVAAKYLKK